MNPILVQSLLWLLFFICLYCLRSWHKHQADIIHKYKVIKVCLTIYGIYRMTYFLQKGIMGSEAAIGIPSLFILVCLNLLLYVQVIRLLNPSILKILAAFQKENRTTKVASLFYQSLYLSIIVVVWLIGIQEMSDYYQFSTITVSLTDVWDFVQVSLYILLPITLFYTFLLAIHDKEIHLFRGFFLAIACWVFMYCVPGWLLIFEEKPFALYGFLLLCQEYIMYQFLKNKVQKELLHYQNVSLGKVIGKLMTKIK
ncbi:hypothetical protein HCJ52_14015 [Listeria sp. FSL L7-1485]|uniref:Uncharacterized protein n=1 Tax=Listeria immobilis TaxID=2713502 RepID=A0A7X0XAH5_9LIST|nr:MULTISPECIES: hypothetical protein [Listeria]MBC1481570.1 hypothetical protein [Listeria seeligeri]MBC1490121.1 hypothetical protein [Listeria immobilis]MBC1537229.1 hypothetical protein [Listeria immobilis]